MQLIKITYHDGERRAVHDDGENGGCEATEELSGAVVKGKDGNQGHCGEHSQHKSEETQNLGLLSLRSKHDEDQHVDGFNHCTSAVNGRHQNVVWGHKRQPVPV